MGLFPVHWDPTSLALVLIHRPSGGDIQYSSPSGAYCLNPSPFSQCCPNPPKAVHGMWMLSQAPVVLHCC